MYAVVHRSGFKMKALKEFRDKCRSTFSDPPQKPPLVKNCNQAKTSGVYVVDGVTTFCDATTAGGGWELFMHTDNAQIPGPLTKSNGNFDPVGRGGQANTAIKDIIAKYPEGTVEIAIAWGGAATTFRDLKTYEAAVAFMLPIPKSGQTFEPSPNGNCKNGGYTAVTVKCLTGKCGDIVGTMYTGTNDFGVCYGKAYGLVRSNSARQPQCDWGPDAQDFSAVYVSHTGNTGCRYVYQHGTKKSLKPGRMTMWVRRLEPKDCLGVPFGTAIKDPCGVCNGDGSSCAKSITSCTEAAKSGLYRVSGAMTYCDAQRDGGGWSLVASFVNTDGQTSWTGHDGRGGLPGSLGRDLIAWWNFDEPTGNSPLTAAFSHIDDAKLLVGKPVRYNTISVVPGIIGKARHFTGNAGSCISISSAATRGDGILNQGKHDFSMSIWIKGEKRRSSHQRVWSKAGGWSKINDGFGIQFNPNRPEHPYFRIQVGDDTTETVTPEATMPLGRWVHLVATFDRETGIQLYVDGKAGPKYDASRLSGKEIDSEMAMTFGCVQHDNVYVEYYKGAVDNVGMWSRVLTSADVAALYNHGQGIAYKPGQDDHDYDSWRDSSTFGVATKYKETDFKSPLFARAKANDIMISDAFGWVSFHNVLGGGSMAAKMASFQTCQTTAAVVPGSKQVHASSKIWRDGAMLAFYAGDPNSKDRCAFSNGQHSDSTVLAISGAGCGTMGAGQVGTNYVKAEVGLDWHASLNAQTTCKCCDQCKGWHGLCTAVSNSHTNNKGPHDASQWGALWVRDKQH